MLQADIRQAPGAGSRPPVDAAQAMAAGWGGGMPAGGGWGQMPGGMPMGGGGYGDPFGQPGSGAPASIGDCVQGITMVAKRSVPVVAVAWFSLASSYLLFCCPSYLLNAMAIFGVGQDVTVTLGSGIAATCIGLLGTVGQVLAGCLQMGLMKAARIAVVQGKDQVGGLGGAFKIAMSKIIAALVLVILTAILTTIGFALCVIPGFLVLGFMMLVSYLVIAVEISIGEAFKEAIRLIKGAWLPITVMTFVGCVMLGIGYGGAAGLNAAFVAILQEKFYLAAAPCNFLWTMLLQFAGWVFFVGTSLAVETRDANVMYAQE